MTLHSSARIRSRPPLAKTTLNLPRTPRRLRSHHFHSPPSNTPIASNSSPTSIPSRPTSYIQYSISRMTRGNYRGRPHNRGNQNDHMLIDHHSNQRLRGPSSYQYNNDFPRGGRGWRGGPDDRGRGLQIRGRGRGNFKHNDNSYEGHHHTPHDLVKIAVKGVLESNVNNAHDDGLSAVRKWLETRANFGYNKPINYVYLKNVSQGCYP